MTAETSRGTAAVFDVVGRPTARGVTWVWAQNDLDHTSVAQARRDLGGLFTPGSRAHRVLVYLGADRFVDLRGLRLLLELIAEVRRCGGDLAVVAPPDSLVRMTSCFSLNEEELLMVDSVRRAARWARTGKDL